MWKPKELIDLAFRKVFIAAENTSCLFYFSKHLHILTNTGREGVPQRKLMNSYWEKGKFYGYFKSVPTCAYQYKQLLLKYYMVQLCLQVTGITFH